MSKNKLKVKGILFDLDGTILDTKDAYIEAATIAFKAIGRKNPSTERLLELPKRVENKQSIVDIVGENPQGFLDVFLKTFYAIAPTKTKPMPNIANILKRLSQKAKLSVITMRFMPKEIILLELKQHGLDRYFAEVVTALDTCKPKPSPEALIHASDAMDVQMCECVIVGDSVVDVQAGKAAGAKTVAVLTGLYTQKELAQEKPDFIIKDISELLNLIA